ncbi:MAG: hypothetical protein ACI9HK_001203 [Pirellulaceae bacterium]|jgi:hypothetical protein
MKCDASLLRRQDSRLASFHNVYDGCVAGKNLTDASATPTLMGASSVEPDLFLIYSYHPFAIPFDFLLFDYFQLTIPSSPPLCVLYTRPVGRVSSQHVHDFY